MECDLRLAREAVDAILNALHVNVQMKLAHAQDDDSLVGLGSKCFGNAEFSFMNRLGALEKFGDS